MKFAALALLALSTAAFAQQLPTPPQGPSPCDPFALATFLGNSMDAIDVQAKPFLTAVIADDIEIHNNVMQITRIAGQVGTVIQTCGLTQQKIAWSAGTMPSTPVALFQSGTLQAYEPTIRANLAYFSSKSPDPTYANAGTIKIIANQFSNLANSFNIIQVNDAAWCFADKCVADEPKK